MRVYKVKEGKLDKLRDWTNKLSGVYRKEVLESLREEMVEREFIAIFEMNDNYYVFGFMDGECLPATDTDLNRSHKDIMKECLEPVSGAEVLYDLKV